MHYHRGRDLWVVGRARKTFAKYKGELRSAAAEVNDTIGAVAVDAAGHVASTVSSGGNWMKVPGRVGHVRKTKIRTFLNVILKYIFLIFL